MPRCPHSLRSSKGKGTKQKKETLKASLSPSLSQSAPEVLAQKPYSKAVDCWSIGVISYILWVFLDLHLSYHVYWLIVNFIGIYLVWLNVFNYFYLWSILIYLFREQCISINQYFNLNQYFIFMYLSYQTYFVCAYLYIYMNVFMYLNALFIEFILNIFMYGQFYGRIPWIKHELRLFISQFWLLFLAIASLCLAIQIYFFRITRYTNSQSWHFFRIVKYKLGIVRNKVRIAFVTIRFLRILQHFIWQKMKAFV